MWMHNGGLGGWKHIKRKLGSLLADRWFLEVKGGTDSEWAFALFLNTLEQLGHDPSSEPPGGFGHAVLRKAVQQTIAQINELTDSIPASVLQSEDIDTRSLLNFAVTDGHSVICTRYISSSKDEAASLYYSSGTKWVTRTSDPSDREYHMERDDKGADIVLVASEPLTFERGAYLAELSWILDHGADAVQKTGLMFPPTLFSQSTSRQSWCTPFSTNTTSVIHTTSVRRPLSKQRVWSRMKRLPARPSVQGARAPQSPGRTTHLPLMATRSLQANPSCRAA